GAIAEVAQEFSGKLLAWMDTGDGLSENFFAGLRNWLNKSGGFISVKSSGTMSDWTHKGVFEYFKDDHRLYDDLPNCSSGVVVFDMDVNRRVIDEWYRCALNKECIAPSGSSLRNHRQDQAIITYLLAKRGIYCNVTKEELGVEVHLDRTCKEYNKKYERKYGLDHIV
ncbi:11637_t:CDS:1, partial [Diversispora eburnea]